MDELARAARHGSVRDPPQEHDPARRLDASRSGRSRRDVEFGSYGLDQCLDLVEAALASGRGAPKPDGRRLAGGHGHRAGDARLRPADRAPLRGARWRCWPDGTYHLAVGSTEMGNGSVTSHRQIAATVLGTRGRQHRHRQCRHRPDALRHRHLRQHRHRRRRPGGGAGRRGAARQHPRVRQPPHRRRRARPAASRTTRVVCGDQRDRRCADLARGRHRGRPSLRGQAQGLSARRARVAFNVHGFRIAVHRVTGEIRILQSVHAADIGRLINPMQCRGQIEGAIAMGFGWALTRRWSTTTAAPWSTRRSATTASRPSPTSRRTEVFFADTYDTIGPLGAKAQGECAINPVAPGDGQRARRRHRRPLRAPAVHARPHLRQARGQP